MSRRNNPQHPSARSLSKILTAVGVVVVFTLSGSVDTLGLFQSQRAEGYSVKYPVVAGCPIDKRFSNWGSFVQNGISTSGFFSNWSDLFTKNMCQLNDINFLQDSLDGAQAQLRQKIFACQTASVAPLVQKVNDLKFEIEYVRHMMDTDEEQPAPDGSKAVVRSPSQLSQLLNDSVVVQRGLVSPGRFSQLFAQFENKYASKIDLYRNCKDGDWLALTTAWNDFVSNWAGLSPAWNKLKKQTSAKVDTLSGPLISKNFLKGVLDVRLNNLEPTQTLTGIYKNLTKDSGKKNITTGDTSKGDTSKEDASKKSVSSDFLSTITAATQDASRYDREKEREQRRAYYEVLYKQFGDTAGNEMLNQTQAMNKVINNTLPIMDGARACTKYIADRQCGGK